MPLPSGILPLHITQWENGHKNFKAKLTPGASFNMRLPLDFTQHSENYKAVTQNFGWLIQEAINNNWQLKPLGRGWSFSQVANCKDGLVDTKELRNSFNLGPNMVSDQYKAVGKTAHQLFFAECGMSMEDINRKLEQDNGGDRCLKACGASNGQTIAGAISTGTHGAAWEVGAAHDSIVGMHLVTGANTHVFLQRASNIVVSQKFIDWIGATPINDDDIFNAALVSFGSFGFIHGILLETDPKFLLLKKTVANIPYNDLLRHSINTWDFGAIESLLPFPMEGPNGHLYHFEMVINPFKFKENDASHGAYLKVMYKQPWDAAHVPAVIDNPNFTYGDELLGLIQTVLDHLGPTLQQLLVPQLVTALFPQAFNPAENIKGTIGEIFNNTKWRGQVASASLGLPTEYASQVLDEFVALNQAMPFAGGVAIRFVKGTDALLGFTKFRRTCVLEMDGVESASNRSFFEAMWDRLEQLGIPYTVHWGKINHHLNPQRVRNMYGNEAVDKWIACRHQLLDAEARAVFNSPFLEQCGLDG